MVKKKSVDFSDLKSIDGIGPTTAKKLTDAGVSSPIDLVIMGSQEYSQVTGKSKEEAVNLVEKVTLQLEDEGVIPKIRTITDLIEYREKQFELPVGCKSLDDLIQIESQSLTELYGQEGSGKTQYVETLCVNTISDPTNDNAVYFIDCEGTMDIGRMKQIGDVRDLKPDFSKLLIDLTGNTDSLERAVKSCTKRIIENKVKLIIVDGLMGIYRMEYDRGRAELNTRQNDVKIVLRRLKNIAEYLNVAVLITNQVMGNPDAGYGANPIKPIGGHVLGHNVKHIITFNKGGGVKRTAKIMKSNKYGMYGCEFYLNEAGVWDEEEFKPKEDLPIETKTFQYDSI